MNEAAAGRNVLPRSEIIAVVLVAAGVGLWMFVSRGLLIVAGLGAFGPGILREVGWLRDHDEFQREAAYRAGYHAYLVAGLAAVVVLSVLEWGGAVANESSEWIRFVVVVLWLTWLSSMLLTYWGARKTAARVLRAFGSFWAVFVIAGLIGDASIPHDRQEFVQGLLGVVMGFVVIAPFFGLAWTASRWPRRTGVALLGVSLVFLVVFGGGAGLQWSTRVLTGTLLVAPLAISGGALVLDRGSEDGEEPGA